MPRWRRCTGIACGLLLPIAAAPVAAEPPLNIQQLLVPQQRWQLLSAVDYNSIPGPGGVGQRHGRLSAALRYGAAPGLEINARLRHGEVLSRWTGDLLERSYRSLALGTSWLVKAEDHRPALLLEGSLDVLERDAQFERRVPGGEVLLTAYRSSDPVVLSLTAAYAYRREARQGGRAIGDRYSWSLVPQVNFAVNHRVTLVGGLSFSYAQAPRVDGLATGFARERFGLRGGLGLRLSPRSTIFCSGELASEAGGNQLSLRWFYTI